MKRKTTLLLIAVSSSMILGLWLGAWYIGIQPNALKDITNQPVADLNEISRLDAAWHHLDKGTCRCIVDDHQ